MSFESWRNLVSTKINHCSGVKLPWEWLSWSLVQVVSLRKEDRPKPAGRHTFWTKIQRLFYKSISFLSRSRTKNVLFSLFPLTAFKAWFPIRRKLLNIDCRFRYTHVLYFLLNFAIVFAKSRLILRGKPLNIWPNFGETLGLKAKPLQPELKCSYIT